MTSRTNSRTGDLAALGTVAIWTGFILISRLGGRSALTACDVLALRLGTAALVLLPLSVGARRLPAGIWRDPRLWCLAMLGGAGYGLLVYSGFKHAPAAHGAILLPGLQPFLIALLAWLTTGALPGRARLTGLVAMGAGLACVAWPYVSGQDRWSADLLLGDGLLLLSSVVWAGYSLLAKRWGPAPWTLTRFVALASALVYLPVYLLWLPKALSQVPVGMLIFQGLYQGLGPTILAMLLFLKAVQHLGPERTGAMIALVPVLAGLAAAPLLGEAVTAWLLGGLALVSTGAFLAARPTTVARGTSTPS